MTTSTVHASQASLFDEQNATTLYAAGVDEAGRGPLAGDVAPGGKGPTYEKMLNAYLDEKLNLKPNPVAPQNGNANVGGVPKIQIGTPIKTSS